jgi:hypothetical protein
MCSLIQIDYYFRSTYCLNDNRPDDGGSKHLRNSVLTACVAIVKQFLGELLMWMIKH